MEKALLQGEVNIHEGICPAWAKVTDCFELFASCLPTAPGLISIADATKEAIRVYNENKKNEDHPVIKEIHSREYLFGYQLLNEMVIKTA